MNETKSKPHDMLFSSNEPTVSCVLLCRRDPWALESRC